MTDTLQDDAFFPGFSWAVPQAFAAALSSYRFEQGDVLYDTKLAYMSPWAAALPHIKYSVQVKYPARGTAAPAQAADENTEVAEKRRDSSAQRNWKCSVSFMLTDHRRKESRLVSTTQGRLYTLLRTGDVSWIDEGSREPAMPLLVRDLRDYLRSSIAAVVSHFAKPGATAAENHIVFLMPYDRCNGVLWLKHRKLSHALSPFRLSRIDFATPAEVNIGGTEVGFGPTVQIACFHMDHAPASAIEQALKSALYSRTGKRDGADRFDLGRHGYLRPVLIPNPPIESLNPQL